MSDRKTAVVTGAANGIGRALASRLSVDGYRLCLFDIDRTALDVAAETLNAAIVMRGDVSDPAAVLRLADAAGAVDLLCLNAGVISSSTGAPWDAPHGEWEHVLGVNVLGVVNGLRSFVPRMLEREGPSHILITVSLAGAVTWPGGGPYAASKHAALAVAEQAALELAGTNVTVTALCPALVRTAMSEHGADPHVVAAEALQAVSEGRFAVVPAEWSAAIHQRADDLTCGRQPTSPTLGASPPQRH